MRTTLTIEPDVAALLRQELRDSGKSLKDIVNELLRLAFRQRKKTSSRKPFRTPTLNAGPSLIGNLDNISEVLDYLEGPFRR